MFTGPHGAESDGGKDSGWRTCSTPRVAQPWGTRTRALQTGPAFVPVDACRYSARFIRASGTYTSCNEHRGGYSAYRPTLHGIARRDRIGSAGDAPDTRRRRCRFDGRSATGGILEPAVPRSAFVFRLDGARQSGVRPSKG